MKLLAIDTSTEACSAALYDNGELTSRFELAPRRHAELILPMCEELLATAAISVSALDGLAFGRGPGAFTGVRIATGVIQGIGWAADLPVVPVSSLAALALQVMTKHDCERVAVAMDARMDEVYWGCYRLQDNDVVAVAEEAVLPAAAVSLPAGEWFAAGSGWQAYADAFTTVTASNITGRDTQRLPHAAEVARLAVKAFERGEQLPAEQAIPVYLRDKVAEKKKSS